MPRSMAPGRRGYSSLNSVVTVISKDSNAVYVLPGKIRGTPEYDRFIADHDGKCAINFGGSAGAMESTGVVSCFLESVEVHKVRITNFIGDGDSHIQKSLLPIHIQVPL